MLKSSVENNYPRNIISMLLINNYYVLINCSTSEIPWGIFIGYQIRVRQKHSSALVQLIVYKIPI